MHNDRKRQLLALNAALLLALSGGPACAKEGQPTTLEEKLQAAKGLAVALAGRDAGTAEWREVERHYAALAAAHPRDARVRDAYAELLWSRGERAGALAEWTAAERLDPKNAVVLAHLAGGWLAEGDVKKAAALAARAVASEPENAAYHFTLANISFLFRHELGDATHPDSEAVLQQALAHFAAATRLAPDHAEYARAYAETFYSVAKPDWARALAAWQRFLELTPNKDFALSHLARVHLKLGQKKAALDCLAMIQDSALQKLKSALSEQAARLETPAGGD